MSPVAKGGTMIKGDDVRRFWSKTKKGHGGCVLWTGAVDKDGYGKFMVKPASGRQKTIRPHRWLWERCVALLGERVLLHSCDTPGCVALQHLSPGTQKQNIADAISRGRFPIGNNRKLTDAQVEHIRLNPDQKTNSQLGEEFGVCGTYVWGLRTGRYRR